jgi:hypothetical protein
MTACLLNPLSWRSILVVAAGLALAGCFEASGTASPPPATMGAPTAGPNAATVVAPESMPAAPRASAPATLADARASCWMEMETNKKAPSNLEQRGKLVEQCAQAKVNGQTVR